jgi:hypothetical protein
MINVKALGLAVFAGALLVVLVSAGNAMGAANFCTAQESPCLETNLWATGTTLDFTLKSGTKAKLASTTGEVLEECTSSTLKGILEKAEPATTSIESLTWGTCNFPTTTTELGKLEVETATAHNGTVKADGESKITINGGFFGSCLYGLTSKASVGELKEGKPATLVVNAVINKLSGSATACPETAKWTAEYTLSEPSEKTLSVESGITPVGSVFCTVQESPCKEVNLWAASTTVDFTLKSGTKAKLASTDGEALDECTESTVKGKLEKAEFVTAPIESLTWGGCTFATTTSTLGKLKVENATTSHNGTVKSDAEIKVTINGLFFGSCIYGIKAEADLGELKEGKPATFVANAVAERKEGSAVACPETSKWTAEYTLTEPSGKTLSVEKGTKKEESKGTSFCTVQTSPCPEANRWFAGTTLDFGLTSGTQAKLTDTGGELLVECSESTAKGEITGAGSSTTKVTGPITQLTWGKCIWKEEETELTTETKTLLLGKLEVERIAGTHNGTVTADGITEVTVKTVFYGSCIYGVESGKSLGDLTEGKPAIFHANAIATKQSGSNLACPATAKWTATYTLKEPSEKTLSVESG